MGCPSDVKTAASAIPPRPHGACKDWTPDALNNKNERIKTPFHRTLRSNDGRAEQT